LGDHDSRFWFCSQESKSRLVIPPAKETKIGYTTIDAIAETLRRSQPSAPHDRYWRRRGTIRSITPAHHRYHKAEGS
jgi:hypothetical protein